MCCCRVTLSLNAPIIAYRIVYKDDFFEKFFEPRVTHILSTDEHPQKVHRICNLEDISYLIAIALYYLQFATSMLHVRVLHPSVKLLLKADMVRCKK